MKANRVFVALLALSLLSFSGCELLTPKTEVPKDAYLSAPSMGKASDLPDTGATVSIDGSTPDGIAAAESLYQTAFMTAMSLLNGSKPTPTFSPSLGGPLPDAGRSLQGSKTPVEVSFDVMDPVKNTKIGTGKFKSLFYFETSAEYDSMLADMNTGDPSKASKWLGRTLREFAVQRFSTTLSGELAFTGSDLTLTARAVQSGNLKYAFDMTTPASTTGTATFAASGLVDLAIGLAVSVKQVRADGTSLGGKFLVSYARHFPLSNLQVESNLGNLNPVPPPLTYSYTVRGYNDADKQVFSKTYTDTLGGTGN